ncbi:hypothetical protein N6H18_14040 [Reichenbachiella agarivorans]|uniref:Uncharacterized protein n=1 Tax=Reichenbachiella agarivorans TaxID=2979464 RepID=A0ABY6CNZ2_9BACT|nr:hypothetical protein [Reichenbachiella agarivorans]UXP31469.1 hypothetical protein N6H18_14040 [Reichenbachiella agarivorans]
MGVRSNEYLMSYKYQESNYAKQFGIFTPYSVNMYSECNSDSPANFLKRNAILFENLVIVPQGIGPLDGSELFTNESYLNAYSKEDIKFKSELSEILLTIEDFVEGEEQLREYYAPSNPETSMWMGENSDKYIEFVKKYVQKKNGFDSPEIQSREHMKDLKYYIGTISSDFQILTESINKFDNFSALLSEIHEDAYRFTYNQYEAKIQTNQVISSIQSLNHFDFGTLSWDEIITLRKSEFLKDFRSKVFEWTQEFYQSQNTDEFQVKIDKYIDDAKFDFIEKRKPNMVKSILTGIAGNFPLPIPVNPVGLISSINQIKEDKKAAKDFGWLFFIQKARKKAPNIL